MGEKAITNLSEGNFINMNRVLRIQAVFIVLLLLMALYGFGVLADTNVAKIGDTGYSTVQAAVDACTDGVETTITLVANVTGDPITKPSSQTATVVVGTGKKIILDLAGHTISTNLTTDGDSYWYAHVLYVNGGTLTLKDSSTGKTGAIINPNTESYFCTRAVLVNNNATFTLQSGRITAASGEGMRIDNATVNLSGGTVEATTGSDGNAYGWDNAVAGVEVRGNSTVVIDGATITSKGENAIFSDNGTDNITIKSGVLTGNSGYGALGGSEAQKTITITGGYFSSDPTNFLDVTVYKAVVQESGSAYYGYYKVEPVVAEQVVVRTLNELLTATQSATLTNPKDITLGANIVVNTTVTLGQTSKLNIPSGYKLSVVSGGLFQNDGKTTNKGELSVSGGGYFSNLLNVEGNGKYSGYPSTTGTYTIAYPMDLEWLSWLNNNAYTVTNVVLSNNITMPDVCFDPIPNFKGTFNGNNHSISNLKLQSTSQPLGLFEQLGDSSGNHTYVKDLTITESLNTVSARCGGLAATTVGKVHITGVKMNGTMHASGATYYFAPFVGYARNNGHHLYIADSENNMTVTADSGANIGPIIGSTGNGQSFKIGVYNFKNTGTISATGANNSVGYVAGYCYGKSTSDRVTFDVINYSNTGSITNNYGTWSSIGTGANYLCCNSGNVVFTTNYISTDYTAYYQWNNDIYTVTSISATGIALDKSWWQFQKAGETVTLVATLTPADSTDTIVWTSSNENVATVNANGTVTAVGDGLTIIKAATGSTGQYAATCAVRVTKNMGYNTFVTKLMSSSGTLDGKDGSFDGYAHDSEGRLIVSWSPQSGCRTIAEGNHKYAGCDHVTVATYETPNRVNGGCAQYQITSAMVSGSINLKNVSFVYDSTDSFWYDANGWNGTGSANTPGELQLENHGNITIENCAFNNVSLTPYHDGAANSYELTVKDSTFTNIQKAGLRGINSKKITVSECTFEDCASGAVDIVQNNNRTDGDVVLKNNVINGKNGYKLRNITNKVYVTGDDTRVNVTTLFSYDTESADVTKYLILSGGTYNLDPSNYDTFNPQHVNYVATGCIVRANSDGTWTIGVPRTVTFDPNGGSGTMEPEIVPSGGKFVFPDCTFTAPDGKIFVHWKVEDRTYAVGDTLTVKKDLTASAIWADVQATRIKVAGLKDVPDELKGMYGTVQAIKDALLSRLTVSGMTPIMSQTVFYDVELEFSSDGGKTWVKATKENFPKGGITVEFDFPDGTNGNEYRFLVAHMLTIEMNGMKPGEIETPEARTTDKKIMVTLNGLSPVAINWQKIDNQPGANLPQTGDASNPVMYIGMMLIALAGIGMLMRKR